jgi:uncharacterized protein YlzI (FlbEa/FlbD family)
MARTAYNLTVIRFTNGRELGVRPSPDEVVKSIRDHEGGLTRVLDVNGNPAWINPGDVVTITSHRPRKRRAAEKPSQKAPEQLDAELAALTDPSPRRRRTR